MAGRADQLSGQVQRQGQPRLGEVEAELFDVAAFDALSDQPHTCPEMALVTSSDRPSALPTSRTAPRER